MDEIKVDTAKADDAFLAMAILSVVVILVTIFGFYLWINKKEFGFESSSNNKSQTNFTPPIESLTYLDVKDTIDRNDPVELDKLKKLLMKRAMKSVPIILSLEKESQSIDRLYKKGILTDDVMIQTQQIKQFVEKELKDVKDEADEFLDGWGEQIWSQAVGFYKLVEKTVQENEEKSSSMEEPSSVVGKEVANKAKVVKKRSERVIKPVNIEEDEQKKNSNVNENETNEEKDKKAERIANELIAVSYASNHIYKYLIVNLSIFFLI